MNDVLKPLFVALAFAATAAPIHATPQNSAKNAEQAAPSMPPPAYAPTVRHILASPFVLRGTITSLTRLKGPDAAAVPPGFLRYYTEATVVTLIRGSAALPPVVGYVVDVPIDAAGHPPKLKKASVMLFARTVPGQSGQIQLVGADGQGLWTPEYEALVRQIVEQVVAPDAPPAISGVGNAFHVPGTLPGEGETQIFLNTETGAPISLQVLRRPGERPRWAVALGEIVDEAAGPAKPNTLLWYRLACGLPRALPASSTANADTPENAAAARRDYQFILEALGLCGAG
jgi:hypothetical protein